MQVRVGQGFDVHPFVDDAERPLVLGWRHVRRASGPCGVTATPT